MDLFLRILEREGLLETYAGLGENHQKHWFRAWQNGDGGGLAEHYKKPQLVLTLQLRRSKNAMCVEAPSLLARSMYNGLHFVARRSTC